MPSSYLEPSIIFDEKEGRGGFVSINRTTKCKFNPLQKKIKQQISAWEIKLVDWIQVNQKSNDHDSPAEVSFADSQSNESTLFNADSRSAESFSKLEKTKSAETNKNSTWKSSNKKHKLKNYITQVGENVDIFGYNSLSHK